MVETRGEQYLRYCRSRSQANNKVVFKWRRGRGSRKKRDCCRPLTSSPPSEAIATSSMAVDPNATTVEPTGLGRTLLGLTLFFPFPVVIVISLRCWVRLKHKVFGVDDWLMVIGWVGRTHSLGYPRLMARVKMLYMGVTGVVARGVYAGIGTRDAQLNAKMQSDGRRVSRVQHCKGPADNPLAVSLLLSGHLLLLFTLHQGVHLRHAPPNRRRTNLPRHHLGDTDIFDPVHHRRHHWPFCHLPTDIRRLGPPWEMRPNRCHREPRISRFYWCRCDRLDLCHFAWIHALQDEHEDVDEDINYHNSGVGCSVGPAVTFFPFVRIILIGTVPLLRPSSGFLM